MFSSIHMSSQHQHCDHIHLLSMVIMTNTPLHSKKASCSNGRLKAGEDVDNNAWRSSKTFPSQPIWQKKKKPYCIPFFRELNELRRPVSDNPEILRFFRYMRAARRGQESMDCMRAFPTCSSNAGPAHTMIAAYHDINKLVTARKIQNWEWGSKHFLRLLRNVMGWWVTFLFETVELTKI